MADLDDALAALDALIKAKLTGASDLSSFYNRRLGALQIDAATSLDTLIALRKSLAEAASQAAGPYEEWTVHV